MHIRGKIHETIIPTSLLVGIIVFVVDKAKENTRNPKISSVFLELLGGFELAREEFGLCRTRFFAVACSGFITYPCQLVPLHPDTKSCLKGKNKGNSSVSGVLRGLHADFS